MNTNVTRSPTATAQVFDFDASLTLRQREREPLGGGRQVHRCVLVATHDDAFVDRRDEVGPFGG